MNQTDLILAMSATLVSLLISAVGYLSNKQLQRVDDKISKFDNEFFEVKSKLLEIQHIDKSALIKHLDNEVIPGLRSKHLEEHLASIRADITVLKEYQRLKIGPAVENLLSINKSVSDHDRKLTDNDSLLYKMYELVKKVVEQKSK